MLSWTEEELREMAAADARIDSGMALDRQVSRDTARALGEKSHPDRRAYYQDNRDRIRAYQKQYYRDNRERILKQRQQRYLRDEKFREDNNARARAWYHRNKGKKREADAT